SATRPWSSQAMFERSVNRGSLSASITFACAGRFALRIRPLAHRDVDNLARTRGVAKHLVQDTDALGDAEKEAGEGTWGGRRIKHALGLGAAKDEVEGAFDPGRPLGDDAKDFVRCVRELEGRIGVQTAARP